MHVCPMIAEHIFCQSRRFLEMVPLSERLCMESLSRRLALRPLVFVLAGLHLRQLLLTQGYKSTAFAAETRSLSA